MGTTRVTRHVPGYSGFIAEAPHNMDALSASDGVAVRPDEKKTMLLASVDQYSRDVVPGYTGWRPQEPVNFRQFPSARPHKEEHYKRRAQLPASDILTGT